MAICEPANYDVVSILLQRSAPGTYQLHCSHRHEGARSYCGNNESYTELSWAETLTLLEVVADGRRPGMHPEGWEQTQLF